MQRDGVAGSSSWDARTLGCTQTMHTWASKRRSKQASQPASSQPGCQPASQPPEQGAVIRASQADSQTANQPASSQRASEPASQPASKHRGHLSPIGREAASIEVISLPLGERPQASMQSLSHWERDCKHRGHMTNPPPRLFLLRFPREGHHPSSPAPFTRQPELPISAWPVAATAAQTSFGSALALAFLACSSLCSWRDGHHPSSPTPVTR